mmetsp:Transcript_79864/g.237923  ORF Transcript_79864/g.237923 Transcript_79864/m.237923 type:complete len:505 (-) Transcript_79864:47-1561(-)
MFPYLSMGDLLSPTPDYWKFLGTASLYGREWQNMALCAASIFCNLFVFSYHVRERPHPKFVIHWRRKVMIRVHVACGGFEMLFAILAFSTARPIFALLTSLWCVGHVITSLYMLSGVFGIRLIMYPAYLYTILLHLVHGVLLFLDPSNAEKLVYTFLTLQIYVWVRVVYVFIDYFDVLTSSQYTVAVILAGMIVGPAVNILGNAGNLLVLCFIALFNMARDILPPCCSHAYPSLSQEGDYNFDKTELSRVNVRFKLSDRLKPKTYANLPDGPAEREDTTARSPRILGGMQSSSVEEGCHSSQSAFYHSDTSDACEHQNTFYSSHASDGCVSRSRQSAFYSSVAERSSHFQVREEKPFSTPKVRKSDLRRSCAGLRSTRNTSGNSNADSSTMVITLASRADEADIEKVGAREVFESLCRDSSVGLTKADVSLLLSIWGLPYHEVDYVFSEHAAELANPEVFSFEEFYKLLQPIWHYAQEMEEAYDDARTRPMSIHLRGKHTVRVD